MLNLAMYQQANAEVWYFYGIHSVQIICDNSKQFILLQKTDIHIIT